MTVTSALSIFMLQSLNRRGWEVGFRATWEGASQRPSPPPPSAFSSEIHLHPRKIMVYPRKSIKERLLLILFPISGSPPKCKVLIIKPKFIFHLPDNGNCFLETVSDSIRVKGVVEPGSGEDLPIFELICIRAGRSQWLAEARTGLPSPHPALTSSVQTGHLWSCSAGV